MSKFGYVIRRLSKIDYGRMRRTVETLHQRSGKSKPALLADMARCAFRYNAGYMDYAIAEMYRLNHAQRQTVITRGINNNIVRRMNDKAYWHFFDDKAEFNRKFAAWVDRDWLRFDNQTSLPQLEHFLQGKQAIFVKPIEGSSGVGVTKFLASDWAGRVPAFFEQIRTTGISIVEDCVVQHPRMAALCPTSVNTVRIATLLGEKQQGIVYAFLRIGNGKVMDNVDCGGMAARVDLSSGQLLTVAADKQGNVFEKHPITETPIIGFSLPYFAEAREMCLQAMRLVPQLRYVAWDVALTEKGPRLIEGNSFPSHAVPQFAAHYPNGIGILPEFKKFIDIP